MSARFTEDGRRVVTASIDNTARVWDAESAKELAQYKGLIPIISADGRRIVAASSDHSGKLLERVLEAESGEEVALLKGHSGGIRSVLFSREGRRLVTTSSDNTARVWDSGTGKLMLTLTGHTGPVLTASFSPDGAVIRTAGLAGSDGEGQNSIRVLIFDTRPASQTFRKYLEAPPPRAVPNSGR